MTDTTHLIAAFIQRLFGPGEVNGLARLTGGANMESWSLDHQGQGYVLRRAPSEALMQARALSHTAEARLVRMARASGVKAPDVVGELKPEDGLGTGYLMRRVEAEVNPAKILANAPPVLLGDLARELARIHAIPLAELPPLPILDTQAALAELRARFEACGGDRPILALAIRWCEDNLPCPVPHVLVHGDFRMGNIMVDSQGLAAVLDWELAHLGDGHEDLAYGCMNVWRFGQSAPAFGVGALDSLFAAYEAAGGEKVDPKRFRFWLVYRTLWWALGCVQMADAWRTGADRNLEKIVIGRRMVENEADLLLLLEEDAPETQRLPHRPEQPAPVSRSGEPSITELLEAVREWVDQDIKSKAQGRDRFMAAVAMNALGMAIRESENPLGMRDKTLADDILAGRITLHMPGVLTRLRKAVIAGLETNAPKYAALATARERWIAG